MNEGLLQPGEILEERYSIRSVVGRGAYGVVYLAEDLKVSGAQWAVKEIWEGNLDDEERREALDMFWKEASVLSTLNHTGVPKVIDHFSQGNRHYLVMEYIEGETLEEKMRHEMPDLGKVISWALKICDILEYLHTHDPPLIFRDLKPSNVIITARGRVILIDFGIARYFSPQKVKDTHIMGTPGFSPPEQYGTGQSDPRSDVYSLGATIYYLLCGEDLAAFNFDFPPLSRFNSSVSPGIERIIGKCISKDRADRYQDVRALKDELLKINAPSHPVIPSTVPPAQATPAPPPRKTLPELLYLWSIFGISLFLGFIFPWFYLIALMVFLVIPLVSLVSLPRYISQKSWSRVAASSVSIVITAAICFTAISNLSRPRGSGLTACKSNLKNIGTAMEMYSTDNRGRYPPRLDYVTPNYLKIIPTCCGAGKVTYQYTVTACPDTYTVWCSGKWHTSITKIPGYPQYDSIQGLIESP